MKYIADLHIHSHYSVAVSKDMTPERLDYWARIKGIKVIGTGDFTHPGWFTELKEKLEPAEQGLFKLRNEFRQDITLQTPFAADQDVRFVLSAEISSIYKKYDKVRKVHNLILAPDFETVEGIQQALSKIGNLKPDGRPILGCDSRDLLEICLNANPNIFFIPAHIWTPWFSMLGDKSGFDSVSECFGDLSEHIFAVETGLSSDPPMNWMCSFLDRYTLLSNSDAHSPEKLGRNANFFDTELSYDHIIAAIKSADTQKFSGSIDMFPQEGKYHYDGHRKCNVCWDPVQTLKNDGICPVCGKQVTVGVMNRVVQLSDRADLTERKNRLPFFSIIPLKEILAEITNSKPESKGVAQAYQQLVQKAGSEFNVLLHLPLAELRTLTNEITVEALRRMREGEVIIKEGCDGDYGQITVFAESERKDFQSPKSLFADMIQEQKREYRGRPLINFSLEEYRRLRKQMDEEALLVKEPSPNAQALTTGVLGAGLNAEQRAAVEHFRGPALIIAGPGTGKTRVLSYRVAHLIQERHVAPENILAVTFTNKAADEIKLRLEKLLGNKKISSRLNVATFHALGYSILKEQAERLGRKFPFIIIDEDDTLRILNDLFQLEKLPAKQLAAAISHCKQFLGLAGNLENVDRTARSINKPENRRARADERGAICTDFPPQYNSAKNMITQKTDPGMLRPDIGQESHVGISCANPDQEQEQDIHEGIGCANPNHDHDQEQNTFSIRQFSACFSQYENYLQANNAFDLDDLIYQPIQLSDTQPEVLSKYRGKFQWILVDEYQDINNAQYQLIKKLALCDQSNLCVIGDPNQAIYGFRGADVRFIKSFLENYPSAQVFQLKTSYRCSNHILKASANVLNEVSGSASLLEGLQGGLKINIAPQTSDKSEAEFVARTIEQMMGGLRFFSMDSAISEGEQAADIKSLSDFAILCRIGKQMSVIEKALNDHSIPYQAIREQFSLKEEPLCTIIDILRAATNSENRFLKRKILEKQQLSEAALTRISELAQSRKPLKQLLTIIIDSYFTGEKVKQSAQLKMMLELANPFGSDLQEFLRFAALGSAPDSFQPNAERVALLTLHAAKGLEFKCVFIVGCEEGLIPYSLFESQRSDLDEERRLLYVGMTRAEKYLFLTHANRRFLMGREYELPRSSLLSRIEQELIELQKQEYKRPLKKDSRQLSLF